MPLWMHFPARASINITRWHKHISISHRNTKEQVEGSKALQVEYGTSIAAQSQLHAFKSPQTQDFQAFLHQVSPWAQISTGKKVLGGVSSIACCSKPNEQTCSKYMKDWQLYNSICFCVWQSISSDARQQWTAPHHSLSSTAEKETHQLWKLTIHWDQVPRTQGSVLSWPKVFQHQRQYQCSSPPLTWSWAVSPPSIPWTEEEQGGQGRRENVEGRRMVSNHSIS